MMLLSDEPSTHRLHPQFNQRGAKGYSKFYTYTDTSNMTPKADFTRLGAGHA